MIKFEKLNNLKTLLPFKLTAKMRLCDETIGTRYLWGQYSKTEYAIFNETLILKETFNNGQVLFRFPMGKDITGALSEIENYTIENYLPLKFMSISDEYVDFFKERYSQIESVFNRDYSDYIYNVQNFLGYKGKALSGQRNHLNKFKKLYPNACVEVITKSNLNTAKNFLKKTENIFTEKPGTAKDEYKNIYSFIDDLFELGCFGCMLKVEETVVGVAVGEVVNDTLYEHIEKADKSFVGAYPTLACAFATQFTNENVLFVNREDDSGDLGLRTSKTQYKPCEIRNKNIVTVKTLFDEIPSNFSISTKRLTLTPILEQDKESYARLCLDDKLNELWGYDYREDLNGKTANGDYFFYFQNFMKDRKEEFCVAVKLGDKLIGELPLHHFDYNGGIEIGFRFFNEHQGKGYAVESALSLIDFIKEKTNAKYVKSRCFKQNDKSKRLITKLGLVQIKEDKTHYYFRKDF